MNLKLSEDPKEWRKTAWTTAMGLAVLTALLRWRRGLPAGVCVVVWAALAAIALAAAAAPRWFRGFYRFSMRLGFAISKIAGLIVLSVFFVAVVTPLAMVRRVMGKDPLRLKRQSAESYWTPARPKTPLDRMF
jgi:hypothetical protein